MTLFSMCINVIASPKVIEMYKSQILLIPVSIKTVLLEVLCKRGLIKDIYTFKQLVNSKVTEMNLSECVVTDKILSCLCNCKYLEKLDLSLSRKQNRFITEQVLSTLFSNLCCLRILAIPHCKEVSDKVMKVVSKNCTKLNELYIPYSSITDISLYHIAQNLYVLSVLNILGTQISDLGMEYLTSGPYLSKSLTELNIDKCPNISPLSSAALVEKCPNIKIFFCGYIGGEDMFQAPNRISTTAKQVFWSI